MEEKKSQRKKIFILVAVLGLSILTVGVTYAFFTYTKQGVEEQKLTTGTLYFVYDELPSEDDSNKITIGNAFPVSDDKGKVQEKPGMFEFEVRAKTKGAPINYEIYLTKDDTSTLPEKVVDTYLTTIGTKGGSVSDEKLVTPEWDNKWKKDNGAVLYQFLWNSHVPVLEEGQQGKSLYQETIPNSDDEYSKIFRYRMWLDESAEGVNSKGEWIYGGKSFTVKVNVYASNEELPSPTPVGVMQSWTYDIDGDTDPNQWFPGTDYHTSNIIYSISSIKFANKIDKPIEATSEWDISEKKDKSVMAYLIPSTIDGETCEDSLGSNEPIKCNNLIIASNGETYGNSNSNYAFAVFTNLKTMDFTNYNSSLIENANSMFAICSSLTLLDLSSWNTSSLKTIGISNDDKLKKMDIPLGMFGGCSNLTTLNLENWDTSNVVNMSQLFGFCPALTTIVGIDKLVTSQVTDMSLMFAGCNQSLDLNLISGWDTSNVTNMSAMFSSSDLTNFSFLEKWDVSSVENMSRMFDNCSQLSELDLSGWDTSSVTNMSRMFDNCSQLSELDLSSWVMSNVIEVEYMFSETDLLETVYVKDEAIRQWFINNTKLIEEQIQVKA